MSRPEMTYEPDDCPVDVGVNEDCAYECPECPLRAHVPLGALRRAFAAVGRLSVGIARRTGGPS